MKEMLRQRCLSRFLLLIGLFLTATFSTLTAQTVIDLGTGKVRGKTTDDYKLDEKYRKRAEADSLQYIDHVTRALNALNADSLEQAEELFKKALHTRPDAPSNYILRRNIGKIKMAQGRYREAVTYFSEVLKEQPEDDATRYDRAVSYYLSESHKAALTDCDALLAARPDSALRVQTLFIQAGAHSALRRTDLARTDLEEILRHAPGNQSATLLLAATLEDLGQPQAALQHLNDFVTRYPANVDGLAARAQLEVRLGLTDLALADYAEAIRVSPSQPELYVERARLYLTKKEKRAAQKDLNEAVRLGTPRGSLTELFRATQ